MGDLGIDPFGNSVAGVNSIITACDDGSYCCGFKEDGSNCCSQGKGVWMVDGKETTVNPNATASASTSPSSTPAALSGNTEPDTVTGAPSRKNNTAAILGGVVGGVAGLALIAGLLWWLFRYRPLGRTRDLPTTKMGYGYPPEELDQANEKQYPVEMPNVEIPFEADGMQRSELAAGTKLDWRRA